MLQTRDLSVLEYANGFTLWHFITHDPATQLHTQGYFDEAAEMFRPGDLILANIHQSPADVESLLLSITRIDHGNVSLGKIAGNIKETINKNFGDILEQQKMNT